jgi:hypothetical protein
VRPARLIAAATVLVGLALPSGAMGAGETYLVVQCHPENRNHADAVLQEPRPYGITTACADSEFENAIQINNRFRAEKNRSGAVRWIAPPDTGIVGVRVDAKLRRAEGHRARLYMADRLGRETRRIAYGDGSPGTFHAESWTGTRQAQFVAELGCEEDRGCAESSAAKTWVRHVRLEVADYSDPEVTPSGLLFRSGWIRGQPGMQYTADDLGSGVRRVDLRVNDAVLTIWDGQCFGDVFGTSLAARMTPCTNVLAGDQVADTSAPPFTNGQNTVSTCATDFAGNETCASRSVQVDNQLPSVAFSNTQLVDDPELIRASVSDAHSGVAGGQILYRADGDSTWHPLETTVAAGELRARVDSTAVPEGVYEFRAVVTDNAGNHVETTQRQDGRPMVLAFPLKSGVELDAALEPGGSKRTTIPYGRRSRVRGILREVSGDPIANQEIVIEEYFGDGALIRERITRVQTDGRGRWHSRLPAGPSRRVTARYAGSQRYLSESTLGGRLAVRTRASLRTSRARVPEGGRVVFRGKLGRLGARIPRGGKLLELQVKEDRNSYQTVGQGFRSKPNGSYKVPYRFGRFYQYDVRFKFRVKVAREADWPYKAPVRSRGRTVTVLDR